MSIKHISDEQVQDYLDKPREKQDSELVQHIRQCGECRAKLHHYRLLYRGLRQAESLPLSHDFTDKTMKAIRGLSHTGEESSIGAWLGGIAAFAAMVVATLYFFGTSWILDSAGGVREVASQSPVRIFDFLLHIVNQGHDFLTILAAAAVILVGIGLLDKAIKGGKLRRMSPLSL